MKESRPNILLIMTDNQSADFLGCYGNHEVKTPNIDLLSKEGMKYTSAYCTNAMCSPCRASVLTGLMPTAHGIHNWLDDKLEDLWPEDWNAIGEFESFPQKLKDAGYNNALIGKYHLGKAWKSPKAFDHWVTFPHGHTKSFYDNKIIDNDEVYNHQGHSVDFFTLKTIEYLNQIKDHQNPFFCFVPFNGPYGHWPSIKGKSTNKFASLYEQCELSTVPREGINKRVIKRYSSRLLESGEDLPEQFSGPLLLPNNKDSIRNYFSQASLIDEGVGKILSELKSLNLFENTIIIYTSDHGFSLGNHGIWGHGLAAWPSSMHRPSFNIPLIFSGPKINKGISKALVSQTDLANTILSMAGVSKLKSKLVNSISLKFTDEDLNSRDMIFMEQEETRAVRTHEWLYIERFNKEGMSYIEPELYNLIEDPDERKNLFKEESCREIIKTFSKEINDYFNKYGDSKYNLWIGGTAKSNVSNPKFWKKIWGSNWKTFI